MTEPRPRLFLPMIAALVLTGLAIVFGNQHLCHLHSAILEVTLLVVVATGCIVWTARAGTTRRAWARVGLSLLIAIVVQVTYLTWLHSPAFPDALLSAKARERQRQIDELGARVLEPAARNGDQGTPAEFAVGAGNASSPPEPSDRDR